MGTRASKERIELPLAPENRLSEGTPVLAAVEECIRYYPPNMEAVNDPASIFLAQPAPRRIRSIDLFVDVPFCSTICGFCPFNVYRHDPSEVEIYLRALRQEIHEITSRHDFGELTVRTVWVGGGTPSVLDEHAFKDLLGIVREGFDLSAAAEFTVEIKPTPEVLTAAKFEAMRRHGVTRISMGVQSTHAEYLRILGRGHTTEDAFQVIDRVKAEGFALNIDMMYRLPGQDLRSVEVDLDAVRGLGIDHLSWFPYVPHEGTSLAKRIERSAVPQQVSRSEYLTMFGVVRDRMAASGYEQYTPYHFALTGRCEYHIGRWQMPQRETLGIGPGAFSFFNGTIYANEHDPARYALAVQEGKPPVMQAKGLTWKEDVTRLAVLGSKFFALDMDQFRDLTGVAMEEYYARELELLVDARLVEIRDRRVECTLEGMAFNNDVAAIFGTDIARRTRHPQPIDFMGGP